MFMFIFRFMCEFSMLISKDDFEDMNMDTDTVTSGDPDIDPDYSWASASRKLKPASPILVRYWTKNNDGLCQLSLVPDLFRYCYFF
jgi:hypothetical protein